MNEPKPISPPDGPWMRRLREGMKVWLAKEKEYAVISFPWQPPHSGHCSGRLVLRRVVLLPDDQWTTAHNEVWFVGSRGEGFDGKPLIQLCEGHLPEDFAEVACEEMTNLMETLDAMKFKILKLEARIEDLESGGKYHPFFSNN